MGHLYQPGSEARLCELNSDVAVVDGPFRSDYEEIYVRVVPVAEANGDVVPTIEDAIVGYTRDRARPLYAKLWLSTLVRVTSLTPVTMAQFDGETVARLYERWRRGEDLRACANVGRPVWPWKKRRVAAFRAVERARWTQASTPFVSSFPVRGPSSPRDEGGNTADSTGSREKAGFLARLKDEARRSHSFLTNISLHLKNLFEDRELDED